MTDNTERCSHTFVQKHLTLPKPTYCTYCTSLLWVFQGQHRFCTRCSIFLHEQCYHEVVKNIQQAVADAERSEAGTESAVERTNGSVGRATEMQFDVVYKSDVFLEQHSTIHSFIPHQHEFIKTTFILPASCDCCNKLMGPLTVDAVACSSCDYECHVNCALTHLPPDSFTVLASAKVDSIGDPTRSAIISDTILLLGRYHRRHPHWALTALNPIALHDMYLRHATFFHELCNSLQDALLPQVELKRQRDALRYATAVYGEAYKLGYMTSCFKNTVMRLVKRDLIEPKDEVNNVAVTDILALPRSCLRYSRWSYKVLEPSYAVLVDKGAKLVVLSFRGSLSDADFLTDACGHLSPFCGGEAHSGMTEQIFSVFQDAVCLDLIKNLLAKNSDYEFLITGHSLGAGLAQLFAAQASIDNVFGASVKMRCYAFAPPPVMTHPLVDAFDDLITCVVAGTDVVCRLQLNTVDRLVSEMSHHSAVRGNEAECAQMTNEVSIAGKVFMLTRPKSAEKNRLVACPRNSVALHYIFVHGNMISNHLMDNYADGLSNIKTKVEISAVSEGKAIPN